MTDAYVAFAATPKRSHITYIFVWRGGGWSSKKESGGKTSIYQLVIGWILFSPVVAADRLRVLSCDFLIHARSLWCELRVISLIEIDIEFNEFKKKSGPYKSD